MVLGLAAAFMLVDLMRTMLYEVEPFDPTAIAAVCGVIVVGAMVATWWPARRAMAADPAVLLRNE